MENRSQYEKFVTKMKTLDLDDVIAEKQTIKNICMHFLNMVKNEEMLHESLDYINEKALEDNDLSIKFAKIFTSCFFKDLAMKNLIVQCEVIARLKKNYMRFEQNMDDDREKFYNSITLLGEYYNRYKTLKNEPMRVLGNTILKLLQEIIKDSPIDKKAAGVILTQITQNGNLLKDQHEEKSEDFILNVQRKLTEPNLTEIVKVMLEMTAKIYNNSLTGGLIKKYTDLLSQPAQEVNVSPVQENPSPQKSWRELMEEEEMR